MFSRFRLAQLHEVMEAAIPFDLLAARAHARLWADLAGKDIDVVLPVSLC